MNLDNNHVAFFALVKAGLWEDIKVNGEGLKVNDFPINLFSSVDWQEVIRIAEEQSVVGLMTAGIEANTNRTDGTNINIPQEWRLRFVGSTLNIEQRNKSMNEFVAKLIELLRKKDVYAILVKGQGIAQCYEKPLWRVSGDIDLLLSDFNYEKAKMVLLPLALETDTEFKSLKHFEMTLKGGFVVELHGMLHSRLSKRVDKVIDEAQRDVFYGGSVRSWMNGGTIVFLSSPDNDVIFVFTHILKHFYIEGVGLRQICDWCRLIWTYRKEIDVALLEKRLRKAGLMTEWKAFAALAVDWLGMPKEEMPLYSEDKKWSKKAERILEFVLVTGNFGHNREIRRSKSFLIGKIQAAWFKTHDFARHARVFPRDSVKFFLHYFGDGIHQARVNRSKE